jgi:hypothetical protein
MWCDAIRIGDFEMTSFLNFHAFAAARGDGLRPEFRALFERVGAAPHSELALRNDGMIQSGPDPISAEVPLPLSREGELTLVDTSSASIASGAIPVEALAYTLLDT